MNKVLIDTNVLIYALDQDSRFHFWSRKFFEDPGFECATTSKNLSEFFAVTTRGNDPVMSIDASIEAIKLFASHCQILYPDSLSQELLLKLLQRDGVRGILVHDYEIAAIGLAYDIKQIATLNAADFAKVEELKILSPLNV